MTLKLVLMGVSGCGKSSIGAALAQKLSIPFFDGDDYHSAQNVAKMESGQPLTDEDRQSWLSTLNALIHQKPALVLACSALKKQYREQLTTGNPELKFLYLHGDFDTIWQRLSARDNHYFKGKTMLESQFQTLEAPTEQEAITLDIRLSPNEIIEQAVKALEK